jgi:hypothetical protein
MASGPFAGTMAVSNVFCDAGVHPATLTVQLTGVVAKTLLEVSFLIDPDTGAGTYDLTNEPGQGGVSISDQSPPGGTWGPAVDPSTATLDTTGRGGTFSVTAKRSDFAPIQVSGAWSCGKVTQPNAVEASP